MMGYYDYGYGYPGYHSWFEMVFFMLFWVALISFIVYMMRRHGKCRGKHCGMFHDNSAMDILKERYAKGEIDKKEFEEVKKNLVD